LALSQTDFQINLSLKKNFDAAFPLKKKVAKTVRKRKVVKESYRNYYWYAIIIALMFVGVYNYGKVIKGVITTYRLVADTFTENNYPHYTSYKIRIPKGYTLHGIDVSRYQGKINWDKVAAMQERDVRIDFAFIKATEGVLHIDPYFQRNWKLASKAGLMRGAYHYFKPRKAGLWQANLFLQAVNFDKGDLLPVVDIEETGGKSKAELQKNLTIFLNQVEKKLGVKPIIYTGYKFYLDNLHGKFNKYPIWIAHYYRAKPKKDVEWKFWQHSDKARINGIVYNVDMNVFNGDADDLEKLVIP